MPVNDVPNISVVFNEFGLDITVNAELQSSQKVMINKISIDKAKFNSILHDHAKLWLKMYLKYEHQPRYYHWILKEMFAPLKYNGDTILNSYSLYGRNFEEEREYWISFILENNKKLQDGQIKQLHETNKKLNMAIRLTRVITRDNEIWNGPLSEQIDMITSEIIKLKSLVDFFVKGNIGSKRITLSDNT